MSEDSLSPPRLRWVQTPEGRRHMSEIAKRRHAAGTLGNRKQRKLKRSKKSLSSPRRKALVPSTSSEHNGKASAFDKKTAAILACFGYCTHAIEEHARRTDLPYSEIADGVGELILNSTRR